MTSDDCLRYPPLNPNQYAQEEYARYNDKSHWRGAWATLKLCDHLSRVIYTATTKAPDDANADTRHVITETRLTGFENGDYLSRR